MQVIRVGFSALFLIFMLGGCASGDSPKANPIVDGGAAGDAGGGAIQPVDPGQATFVLGLAVNDGSRAQAPRGWPLLLLGGAALKQETSVIPLDEASLSLRVTSSAGQVQDWPLQRLSPVVAGQTLDATHEELELLWALTAEQTQALALGSYTAVLSWGGQRSQALEIEIVDPATGLDATATALAQQRRVSLEARLALAQGDATTALSRSAAALIEQPTNVELLVWKARAQEAGGQLDEALASLEAALEQFQVDTPNSPEPPVTILEAKNRVIHQALTVGGP